MTADGFLSLVGVAGQQRQAGRIGGRVEDVEDGVLGGDHGGQFGEDEPADGEQVFLTLEHSAELGEVRLEPVLLAVFERLILEVADHFIDVVLEDRHFAERSTLMDRVRSPLVTAVATSAMARTCVVRLAASWLTFSVRAFHVPAAPGTLA